jgi:hypothetical protein
MGEYRKVSSRANRQQVTINLYALKKEIETAYRSSRFFSDVEVHIKRYIYTYLDAGTFYISRYSEINNVNFQRWLDKKLEQVKSKEGEIYCFESQKNHIVVYLFDVDDYFIITLPKTHFNVTMEENDLDYVLERVV